jgi:hypothetical protein
MRAETELPVEEKVRHPDVAYDAGDMDHGHVFGFLIALAGLLLFVHIVLWGLFQYMGKPQFAGHQTTNPIMTSNEELKEIGGDPALTFPAPRLQPDPTADLNKFRANEEEQMNSYGWVDPAAGKVHIPIDRAIDAMSASWPNQSEVDEATVAPGSQAGQSSAPVRSRNPR